MGPAARIRFGTDGWRGVVADDFTFETVGYAAAGTAAYLSRGGDRPLAVVGYDCRFASEVFAEQVARVLAAQGIPVLLIDRACPTQVVSWTVIDQHAAGGVVITASHNPWLFNGFKYKPETGSSAPPEVIAALEDQINRVAQTGPLPVPRADLAAARASGLIRSHDPLPSYRRQIGRMVDLERLRGAGLRILHECMHGSGHGYLASMLSGGATTLIESHADRNPYFGGVNPEPIPPNLGPALERMAAGGFDLCVCTDGDADRVGIIDDKGRFITQLQVYALLMLYLFEDRGWRGPVVKTVNMTSVADTLAAEFGVEVHEVPVGFKNVAPRMMATDAVLGGEESGGFGFRGHIPERDGLLAGLFLADMIVRRGCRLSRVLTDLEARVGPHAYARHDLPLDRETFPQVREAVLDRLRRRPPRNVAGQAVANLRDDDGFKFTLADGSWVLVRVSGTEPLIRVYAEAVDDHAVQARLAEIEDLIGTGRVAAGGG